MAKKQSKSTIAEGKKKETLRDKRKDGKEFHGGSGEGPKGNIKPGC